MDVNQEAQKFVYEKTKQIKEIEAELRLANFNALVSGKEEFYKEYESGVMKLNRLLNNKEDFEKADKFDKEPIENKLLARQIRLLRNSFLSSQGDLKLIGQIVSLSTQLEKTFNTFRAEVDGKKLTDNDVRNILEREKDSEKLKKAWEASKCQGEVVSKDLIILVKLRNQLAQSLGFKNYYEFSLEANEQKEEEIEAIFKEIADKTEKSFGEVKNEIDLFISKKLGIKPSELRPWHYQNLFFQEAPNIYEVSLDNYYSKNILEPIKNFYADIGIEVQDILERSDLYERAGKYQHACCMDLNRSGDVRIIESIKNNEYWTSTTLHELGHAVYDKYYSNSSLPYLLKDSAHIFVTEAIAQFFGRTSKNINFANTYFELNLSPAEVIRVDNNLKKELKLRQLVFSRWSLVMFNFEREMYKNPEQDLNKLWWDLVKKYQFINFCRDKPDWASKIHLVSSPVYYHNYLLGELLASQIENWIAVKIIKSSSSDRYR